MSPEKLTAPAMPAKPASEIAYAGPAATDGFLQRPFVQNILPFLTSLSLHAAILIIGLLTFTAVQIIRQQPTVNQVTPADFSMTEDTGMPTFAGMDSDKMSRQAIQNLIPNDDMRGASFTKSSPIPGGGGGEPGSASLIQVGAGAFGAGATSGPGGGAHGPGEGGGLLAHFGPSPQTGLGGPMFVTHNGAHRIAFVCDASGSMINKMASLKMELAKAITGLRRTQSFSIVFFQDNAHPDMLDSALVPATPQNIRRAAKFLEGVVTSGSTVPVPGIEAAFRQQPELIYLLTDGDFPDNAEVLAKIRELNKGKKVRVNTIAFVSSNDNDTAFIDLLKTIASENGGTYRHVSEEDLN